MVSALALAAGRSTRMGRLKPLLPFGGLTVLERALRELAGVPVDRIVVVLSHRADEIRAALAGWPVDIVINPDPDGDMLSSIQAGLRTIPPDHATLIAPGDQPLIRRDMVRRLIDAYREHGGIVLPVYEGRRGHPVVIAPDYRDEIFTLSGGQGLKELRTRHPDATRYVPVETDAALIDLDTPEDYNQALERLKKDAERMGDNVYVARQIPEESLNILRAACGTVDVNPHDRALTRQEFLAEMAGRDGLLSLLTERVDDEALDMAGATLKGVANYAVGFNNIDVNACTRRGIPVSNTPDVLTDTTADLAWGLMFAVARRIVEGDRLVRSGGFTGWGPLMMLGSDITGGTLGIIGGGRIGTAMAARAVGFSMTTLYTSRSRHAEIEAVGAQYCSLDDLLRRSDFVSIHVPLTPETTHLIGARELTLMKPNAYLINTARGPVVDEKALVTAVRERRIAGAGLDVFEREPELEPGLAELDNVALAPHIGSATVATRIKMGNMAARNLIAMLQGQDPPNCVNPEWKKYAR